MKTIARNLITASIVAGAVALGGAAQAGPITATSTVELTFPGGSALFPQGYKATTITYDNGGANPKVHSRVAAGMFGGTAANGVDFNISTLYVGENNVLAYCIDILNNLLRNTSVYNVKTIGQSQVDETAGVLRDFGRTLSFLGAVNHVASTSYGFADDNKNWLNPNSNWMSAAIQVGIWESLYEQDVTPLSTANGWFEASSLGSAGDAFLSSAFGAMSTTQALNADQVLWMQNDGGQDLIVDPVNVPAPAPLLLLLGGLMLVYRRRR